MNRKVHLATLFLALVLLVLCTIQLVTGNAGLATALVVYFAIASILNILASLINITK